MRYARLNLLKKRNADVGIGRLHTEVKKKMKMLHRYSLLKDKDLLLRRHTHTHQHLYKSNFKKPPQETLNQVCAPAQT